MVCLLRGGGGLMVLMGGGGVGAVDVTWFSSG